MAIRNNNENKMSIEKAIQVLNMELEKISGSERPIVEIRVTHEAFDCLIAHTHRTSLDRYSFVPSSIYDFKLMGVKFTPKQREI
jgi:hypothetical protein